jgi:hypothetical protein
VLVNEIKVKVTCTKNGQEVAIVNKTPCVVSVLTFVPVFDPLLDRGKYLELAGKSAFRLMSPELAISEEIEIGKDYILSLSQPSTSSDQVKLPAGKKK